MQQLLIKWNCINLKHEVRLKREVKSISFHFFAFPMALAPGYRICVLNQESDMTKIVSLGPNSTLYDCRSRIPCNDNLLFFDIHECKPIHPTDEGKRKVSDISSSGLIILQQKSECLWPRCKTCGEVLKEYPSAIGISVAEVDFSLSQLVSKEDIKNGSNSG